MSFFFHEWYRNTFAVRISYLQIETSKSYILLRNMIGCVKNTEFWKRRHNKIKIKKEEEKFIFTYIRFL